MFKQLEDASLLRSWQTGQWGHGYGIFLVTSLWRHFTWDWTEIEHNIHHWCRYAYAKFRVSSPSGCEDIARPKMGAKICPPPAAGGWRGGPSAAGLIKMLIIYYRVKTFDHLENSGLVCFSLRSRPVSRYYIPQPRVLLYVCVRMCVTLYSLEPIWHWAIWRRLRHSPVTCHIVRVGVDGTPHEHGPHISRPMSTARRPRSRIDTRWLIKGPSVQATWLSSEAGAVMHKVDKW